MSIRGRAISRVVVWFAIAAAAIVALLATQSTLPSLVESPIEKHNLFDVELLAHNPGTSITGFGYNTGTVNFGGTLVSDDVECEELRNVSVFQADEDDSLQDPVVATGGSPPGSDDFDTSFFPNPPGLQTFYAVAAVKPYLDEDNQPHTCTAATSAEIEI